MNVPASRKLTLFCDGASRGNPGPGSYGYVIYEGTKVIASNGEAIGEVTNNVAEYEALLQGLAKCSQLGALDVTVKSDSQVLVRQINGEYKVKAPHLQPLVQKARKILETFQTYSIVHIPREENSEADKLANQALDALE